MGLATYGVYSFNLSTKQTACNVQLLSVSAVQHSWPPCLLIHVSNIPIYTINFEVRVIHQSYKLSVSKFFWQSSDLFPSYDVNMCHNYLNLVDAVLFLHYKQQELLQGCLFVYF